MIHRTDFDLSLLPELRKQISYDPDSGRFAWLSGGRSFKYKTPGTLTRRGYTIIQVMKVDFYAHRLAFLLMTGRMPGDHLDHINGLRSDNRWENLRECSAKMNVQNLHSAKKSNLSTGLLGAYRRPGSARWHSQIRVDGRIVHLGTFDSAEAAHAAYLAAKRKHHEGCTI